MGKVCQFLTELSACYRSVFSFPDDNLSTYQWIYTKLGVYNDIVEICFGIGKFCQLLTELSARNTSVFSFLDDNFSKGQWIFTKLRMCLDIVYICFGIAYGKILSIFDGVIYPQYIQQISKFDICALILWRSALGLLIGKCCQFLTEIICPQHHNGVVLWFYIFSSPNKKLR